MRWLKRTGPGTLFLLAFIHLVLPFTAVNSHPEARIKIAATILGVSFLALAIAAFRRPIPALLIGLGLFLAVCVVAALGGSSPLSEGWPIKLLFVATLSSSAWVFRNRQHSAGEV